MRRARVAVTLVAAIVAIAIAAIAVKVAYPRWKIARLVARAQSKGSSENRLAAIAELVAMDEPEATVALVGIYASEGQEAEEPLRESVELHAALAPPGDPRVRAALWELARDPLASERRRLFAFYLIDELDEPSLGGLPPAPRDASGRRDWIRAVRVARGNGKRLVPTRELDRGVPKSLRLRLPCEIDVVPPADLGAYVDFPYEDLDPRKTLRALAALRGCVVRSNYGDKVLEVRRP